MSKRSPYWVSKPCVTCGEDFTSYDKPSAVKKGHQRQTCGKPECLKILQSRKFTGSANPAYGKTYRTKEAHPEWVENISKTSTERHINVGGKNGMKTPHSRAKASASAIRKFAEHPELRDAIGLRTREAWANGDYDGVRVGQCEWHDMTVRDGRVIKLQGSWEYAYAKWMDEQGLTFTTHVGCIPYVDDEGKSRSYLPDFKMPDGTYVDVKNPLYEEKHARKLQLVREQNGVVIEVLRVDRLTALCLLKHKMPLPAYLPPKMQERYG